MRKGDKGDTTTLDGSRRAVVNMVLRTDTIHDIEFDRYSQKAVLYNIGPWRRRLGRKHNRDC